MTSYSLVVKPSVWKDLRYLPKSIVARVLSRFEELTDEPWPQQALKLEGVEELFRLRVGAYRIIYSVDGGARELIIHHVRHRREVYRNL
jgi:mRNA interferase RelE/StbE